MMMHGPANVKQHVILVGKPGWKGPPVRWEDSTGKVDLNESDTVDCNHLASGSIKGINFSHSAKNLQDLQFGASGYKYFIN